MNYSYAIGPYIFGHGTIEQHGHSIRTISTVTIDLFRLVGVTYPVASYFFFLYGAKWKLSRAFFLSCSFLPDGHVRVRVAATFYKRFLFGIIVVHLKSRGGGAPQSEKRKQQRRLFLVPAYSYYELYVATWPTGKNKEHKKSACESVVNKK